MHAFTHSLAHRAPSATRPRVRWQPYSSLSSQSSSSSTISTKSPSSQISTPSTSISSPPSNTPLPEIKPPTTYAQNSKEQPPQRDTTKKQFAAGLVDQAVKTLSEIWRPQDIPTVFLTSSRAGVTMSGSSDSPSGSATSPSSHPMAVASILASPPSGCGSDSRACIAPIKGFVHEVLRRSRTSGCVLQTALCYLEAVRCRVPELVQKEQAGLGIRGEPDISSRIVPATELELQLEEENAVFDMTTFDEATGQDDLVPTVRIMDVAATTISMSQSTELPPTSHGMPIVAPTPSVGALPSPLLCPRRTFLASLILASKFTQDKCYSNRAWAKLSGLPAREIGRCERALGEALEWRLWVGKTPLQASQPSGSAPVSVPNNRPVARSQSESNILNTPSTRSPFLARQDAQAPSIAPRGQQMLRRSSTVPAEIFAAAPPTCRVTTSQYRIPQEQLPSVAPAFTTYADTLSQSPSPENPGLSYSPSSTESSSGDQTIQMTSFIDEPMATYSVPQAPSAIEFWPYSDNAPQDIRISPVGLTKNNRATKAPAASDTLGAFGFPHGIVKNSEHYISSGYSHPSNLPWLSEGGILPLSLTAE